MKKITFLALAFIGGLTYQAQAQEVILTQNTDEILLTGGVSCGGGDNSFYRAYDLASGDNPYDPALLVGARFAVEAIDGDEEITLNVYEVTSFPDGFDSTAPPAVLTTGTITVGVDDIGTIVTAMFDEPVSASGDAIIVVELFQDLTANQFFPGVTAEETAMAFITSINCGIEGTPQSYDAIGFPDSRIVLDLIVDMALGTDDVALSQISIFPSPASELLNINVPSSIELEGATLYDVLGKVANVSLSNGQINVSGLASGVYILDVVTSGGTLTEKVIIE